MVDTVYTKKFSEFTVGGDLENTDITVGLRGTLNTQFNNPWTFLAPGTTGDRPIPNPAMYYRLRFNTTLEFYEYYDPTIPIWVELSGSGTGTVNPGVTNDLAFYALNGQAVSPIAGAANSVLVTDVLKVPSLSTTLPTGITIPNATITNSTASLNSGTIVAVPVSGNNIVNKTYVDSFFNSGTWTPVLSFVTPGDLSVSYTSLQANYKKNNSVVTIQAIFSCIPTFTTSSGALIITGVPFSATSTCFATVAMSGAGVTFPAGRTYLYSSITSSTISIAAYGSAINGANLTASNITSGTTINVAFTIIYFG